MKAEKEVIARINIIYHLWKKINQYLLARRNVPIVSYAGRELEEMLVSWIFELKKSKAIANNVFAFRTANYPFKGKSGVRHKIDVVIYVVGRPALCFLVECKNFDIYNFRENVKKGKVPWVRENVIYSMLMRAYDLCPKLFFEKEFRINIERSYCMLMTTRPLTSTAILTALSYGICVIQPEIYSYKILLSEEVSEREKDTLKKFPLFIPPEALYCELLNIQKSKHPISKINLKILYDFCRENINKDLENLLFKENICHKTYWQDLIKNKEFLKKLKYLSYYYYSMEGKFL